MQDLKQLRGPEILQKYRGHLKILGNRKVTRGKFRTEYPQILGATAQNSVAWATCRSGFVHPWNKPLLRTLNVSGRLKKEVRFTVSRLWVSLFQLSNHSTDFQETWHEYYDIRGHADAAHFSVLQSVKA